MKTPSHRNPDPQHVDIHMNKNKTGSSPYTIQKKKWIKDLNIRPETEKLIEENRAKTS